MKTPSREALSTIGFAGGVAIVAGFVYVFLDSRALALGLLGAVAALGAALLTGWTRVTLSHQPCGSIRWAAALVPGPRLRRRVRKMLADQEHEIASLVEAGRLGAARWQHVCTWILFLSMVLTGPIVALRNLVSRRYPT